MENSTETLDIQGEELTLVGNITNIRVASLWGLMLFTAQKGQYFQGIGLVRVVIDPPTSPPNVVLSHNLPYRVGFDEGVNPKVLVLRFLMKLPNGQLLFGN